MVNEQNEQKPQFEMRLNRIVCQLGSIPKIVIPSRRSNYRTMKLATTYEKVKAKCPISDDVIPNLKENFNKDRIITDILNPNPKSALPNDKEQSDALYKVSVSSDPNAIKLSDWYEPDIVISVSALKVIFDNFGPNFDKMWEIPVTVITRQGGKRSIFIDKPLVSKALTIIDKNAWFHKIATKCFLLCPWTRSEVRPPKEDSRAKNNKV